MAAPRLRRDAHLSSLAAILVAAVPLFVPAWPPLRPLGAAHARSLRRHVIGPVGVVALVGIDVGGTADELLGAFAVLVAAFGYASAR